MEVVLMAVFTPWQVEMLGGSDLPNETLSQVAMDFFGFIPIRRGHMDREALDAALGVLRQGGVVGIFPEGGIWSAGQMQAQSGVAWLSYRGQAPVLPIGFGGAAGALGSALRLRRPRLTMNVGKPLSPASPQPGQPRKAYFKAYAAEVVDAITALIPPEERPRLTVTEESFDLESHVRLPGGEWASPPRAFDIRQRAALARLLHTPGLLKVFDKNLRLDVRALQHIADHEDEPGAIAEAADRVLNYLRNDNEYFFAYRLGAAEAERVQTGLEELSALARWAVQTGRSLRIVPIRRYRMADDGQEIVQTEQAAFEGWM